MEFKVKKIYKGKSKIKNKFWRKFIRTVGPKKGIFLASIALVSLMIFSGTALLNSGILGKTSRNLLSFLPLEVDERGHTNILLLGVAGQSKEGGNLSDSILVFSIDPKTPSISFLSLPRDLFIASEIGDRKVNEIYAAARYKHGEKKGLEIIKGAISDFANIPIHYSAVVNFNVFENFVDDLGGVDMFVAKDIIDPFYPDKDYGYQTFIVRKGMQHFDGATTLKYARSRKTSSDYDRAQRQQDIILAIRKKASDLSLLTDLERLKRIYTNLKKNINTDIGITEVAALAKVAVGIDYQNAVSAVLNDDPTQKGGFLYTPAREFYGGQFVLLPKDLKDTQKFIELILEDPEIFFENTQISILNGSKMSGLAGEMQSRLRRFGLHVIDVGNYESERPVFLSFFEKLATEKKPEMVRFIKEFLEIKEVYSGEKDTKEMDETAGGREAGLVDVRIVLGTN